MPKVLNTPTYDEFRMAQNALPGLKLEKELQEARKGEQSETFWTTTDALLGCHRS